MASTAKIAAEIAGRVASETVAETQKLRAALYMCASHCQGGHSAAGAAAADALGVPFPLTMTALERKARQDGFDPNELWPWLASMRAGRR